MRVMDASCICFGLVLCLAGSMTDAAAVTSETGRMMEMATSFATVPQDGKSAGKKRRALLRRRRHAAQYMKDGTVIRTGDKPVNQNNLASESFYRFAERPVPSDTSKGTEMKRRYTKDGTVIKTGDKPVKQNNFDIFRFTEAPYSGKLTTYKVAPAEGQSITTGDALAIKPAPDQDDATLNVRPPHEYDEPIKHAADFLGQHGYMDKLPDLIKAIDSSDNAIKGYKLRVVEKENFLTGLDKRADILKDDVNQDLLAVRNLHAHVNGLRARVDKIKKMKQQSALQGQLNQYSEAAYRLADQASQLARVKTALQSKVLSLQMGTNAATYAEDVNMRASVGAGYGMDGMLMHHGALAHGMGALGHGVGAYGMGMGGLGYGGLGMGMGLGGAGMMPHTTLHPDGNDAWVPTGPYGTVHPGKDGKTPSTTPLVHPALALGALGGAVHPGMLNAGLAHPGLAHPGMMTPLTTLEALSSPMHVGGASMGLGGLGYGGLGGLGMGGLGHPLHVGAAAMGMGGYGGLGMGMGGMGMGMGMGGVLPGGIGMVHPGASMGLGVHPGVTAISASPTDPDAARKAIQQDVQDMERFKSKGSPAAKDAPKSGSAKDDVKSVSK